MISSPEPALRIGEELRPGDARTLVDVEREHILATLERTYWRLNGEAGAAALLGMNPSTLRSRMRNEKLFA